MDNDDKVLAYLLFFFLFQTIRLLNFYQFKWLKQLILSSLCSFGRGFLENGMEKNKFQCWIFFVSQYYYDRLFLVHSNVLLWYVLMHVLMFACKNVLKLWNLIIETVLSNVKRHVNISKCKIKHQITYDIKNSGTFIK